MVQGIPRKLCIQSGCDDLAEPGRSRCTEHQAAQDARDNLRKQRAKTSEAALAGAAFYATNRWKEGRASFLARHPLCADCADLGQVVEATEVDHIEPHRGDPVLMWRRSNWQALCKPCHSRKTAREVFGHSRRG